MASDIYARIRAAAAELAAAGIWPTVTEVRSRLGSGSNTTINATLKEWRQEFLARMALTAKRPDWPQGLAAAFDTVWQQACHEAESNLEQARAEARAEAETLGVALKDAQAREIELVHRNDALASSLAESEAQRAQMAATLAEREELLARQGRDLEEARRTLAELAAREAAQRQEHQERLAEAEARAEMQLAAEREAGRKREELAYERLEGVRVRLYEQVEEERKLMKQSLTTMERQMARTKAEAETLEASLRSALSDKDRALGAANAEADGLRRQLEEGRTHQDALEQTHRQMQTQLLALQSELALLAARHQAALELKAERLRDSLAGLAEKEGGLDARLRAVLLGLVDDIMKR